MHTINDILSHTVEAVGTVLGQNVDDRVFPVYMLESNVPVVTNDAQLLTGDCQMTLPPPVIIPKGRFAGQSIRPVSFVSEKLRSQFEQETGLHFPLNSEFATSHPTMNGKPLLIAGGDMGLSFQEKGQTRHVFLKRDLASPHSKGALCCPGGVMDHDPSYTTIKELNEELSVIVSQGDRHFVLFFHDRGQTGISAKDKAALGALALQRIHPSHAIAPQQLELLDVELAPVVNPSIPQGTLTISVDTPEGKVSASGNGIVIYKPATHGIALQKNMAMPTQGKVHGTGEPIDLSQLEQGSNLFMADTESPHFAREVYALSKEEVRYVGQHPHAFMDNTRAYVNTAIHSEQVAPYIYNALKQQAEVVDPHNQEILTLAPARHITAALQKPPTHIAPKMIAPAGSFVSAQASTQVSALG